MAGYPVLPKDNQLQRQNVQGSPDDKHEQQKESARARPTTHPLGHVPGRAAKMRISSKLI
eukprot:CAMPEP_0196660884 /NCGR_PEP_ID=MMETSP1086-20130531/41699_1 /TAXON_ID=77921 /ORGANISM="Cyanoptyche  gloeocystis , Strain SAG4.97" /LENGTH=59 /DNA_ID=CAMNT_0041995525 /DNA_START=1162 /DNA_END=1341 /DNA_ORIENTATION=-